MQIICSYYLRLFPFACKQTKTFKQTRTKKERRNGRQQRRWRRTKEEEEEAEETRRPDDDDDEREKEEYDDMEEDDNIFIDKYNLTWSYHRLKELKNLVLLFLPFFINFHRMNI